MVAPFVLAALGRRASQRGEGRGRNGQLVLRLPFYCRPNRQGYDRQDTVNENPAPIAGPMILFRVTAHLRARSLNLVRKRTVIWRERDNRRECPLGHNPDFGKSP